MNYIVIPKSIATLRTGNNKPTDIYVWATIKLCSNFIYRESHITENKLSQLTGITDRTVRRSIKRLKDADFLDVETKITQGYRKRNTYHLRRTKGDYFFLDNGFFHKEYDPKIAGFLLLIKSICLNNTNKVLWSNSQIADNIGISRNTTTNLLNKCQQLGLVKKIPNGYEITEDSFNISAVNKACLDIYNAICDFCKSRGAREPIYNKSSLGLISAKYSLTAPQDSGYSLIGELNKRCKTLPKNPTLPYFVKALGLNLPNKTDNRPTNEQKKFAF